MRTLQIVALSFIALGALLAVVGLVMNAVMQTPDANIGAGILVLAGPPIAVIGIVGLLAWALLRRRTPAR